MNNRKIAVIGATGYVGGRLVALLCESGYQVAAIGRSISKMNSRAWARNKNIELICADVYDKTSLEKALIGVDVAYYLVHSMNSSNKDYQKSDRLAANNMCDASTSTNLKRIIYLGGLGDEGEGLSQHLKSRAEVAAILSKGVVPVTVLRAAMIIGSGSASFEILRYLTDRLPIMITPKWVSTPNQPIAIRNVLKYLVGCLEHEETAGETYDIGGSEVLTYRSLMNTYAEEAGLRRRIMLPVPVLTPRLSSYWIHLVTPISASIARPLAEGLKNPVVCKDNRIKTIISQELLSPRQAIALAIKRIEDNNVITYWADAGKLPPVEMATPGDADWSGGTIFKDERSLNFKGDRKRLWATIESIGGANGWYHANFLWLLRGTLDRLVGGVGLRRGRRDQRNLQVGDSLDFWRVAKLEKEKSLLLVAEMKLPGCATLEFRIDDSEDEGLFISQIARFKPKGLWGIVYWYMIIPFHAYVFGGMISQIIRKSQ